jgi:hypothetical protein
VRVPPREIGSKAATPTADAARALFDELSTHQGEWIMKIGDPVEVRHSDSVLHLWTIMELLTLHRPAGCSYVEIMGRGGCYSRYFDGASVIVFGAESSVPIALFEAARTQSLEIRALKSKSSLSSETIVPLSLELF